MPINPQNNALVGESSYIRPAQAFVDILSQMTGTGDALLLNFGNGGNNQPASLFDVSGAQFEERLAMVFARIGTTFTIHFGGNALDGNSVDSIMATCVDWAQHEQPTATPTIDLSGGSNAAPNPADVTTLEGFGWTVNHN